MFASTMEVNYFGTLHVLKAALPAMVERRQGEVVLVSSAAAVCGAQKTSGNCGYLLHAVGVHSSMLGRCHW